MEANCHFLEVPAPKAPAVRTAAERSARTRKPSPRAVRLSAQAVELSIRAKSCSGLAVAASRQDATQPEGSVDRGAMRAANQVRAMRQAIARQVRLYCFRLDNCGTFMPLSRARGESRIAVVWTLFVRSLLRSCTGSLHRSVHTRGSSFGGELQVER